MSQKFNTITDPKKILQAVKEINENCQCKEDEIEELIE